MSLYGMLIGIILLSTRYVTALQLNLDDHGYTYRRVPLRIR